METFLVALDGTPASTRVVHYVGKIVASLEKTKIFLFHVLPVVSPNLLTEEEVKRVQEVHEQDDFEHLSGFFWSKEAEEKMNQTFENAMNILVEYGVPPESIHKVFAVESDSIANLILAHAKRLKCSTVVVGRRGLGRVKEILLGSTSSSVIRNAKGYTIWVVDTPQEDTSQGGK
ncbi:MAG: universal stress protein [Deltaproteobacteria bacterium]|nr:universal stress protein [Deltaproteobacteria bacterium]MBW2068807.1 universal stress protein [Deltaproteobacteria bacterium]